MGQIVKQMSAHTTRYYWYPGDRKHWVRGVVALVLGGAAFLLLHLAHASTLVAAVVGTSVTAALAGLNFGRRDSRELARFAEIAAQVGRTGKRQAVMHTGRAAWRGVAEGTGGAAAAVVIANLTASGIAADWLLPLVPAVVGALCHQIGMMYERLGTSESTAGPAAEKPAKPVRVPTSKVAVRPVAPTNAAEALAALDAVSPSVPAAGVHGGAVSIPAAILTPVKSVRPPMPASLALLELAEAHRAELMQSHRDGTVPPAAPISAVPASVANGHTDAPHPATAGAHTHDTHTAESQPSSATSAVVVWPVPEGGSHRPRPDAPRSHRATGRHVGRAKVDSPIS